MLLGGLGLLQSGLAISGARDGLIEVAMYVPGLLSALAMLVVGAFTLPLLKSAPVVLHGLVWGNSVLYLGLRGMMFWGGGLAALNGSMFGIAIAMIIPVYLSINIVRIARELRSTP